MIKNHIFSKMFFLLSFIFITFLLFPKITLAAGEFITTWKTDNPGSSSSTQITIPTTGSGYNYTVDWGDSSTDDTGVTGNITHTYSAAGTYTVTITGSFPRIYFNNSGDRRKILSVQQWGAIGWTSMERAFAGASNLVINASDAPDLSGVSTLNNMFNGATSFNQSINSWDLSNITSLYSMFNGATSFNQSLNSWDVSNVTDMSNMFFNASSFNQSLSSWDVSNVNYMNGMFGNTPFNQNIGSWDVSNVINMNGMFLGASSFNQNISGWDVSNVTSMGYMFENATAFNQNLAAWNMSNASDMEGMFSGVTLSKLNYNLILIGWSIQSLQSDAIFDGGNSQYCLTASASRGILTNTYNWTITDGGFSLLCL